MEDDWVTCTVKGKEGLGYQKKREIATLGLLQSDPIQYHENKRPFSSA